MKTLISSAVLMFISASVYADSCDKIYKGKYVWGHEIHTFEPCNDTKEYWVSSSTWVNHELLTFYKKNTTKPYQPIYVEFRGHLLNEVTDGFADNYNGLIRLSDVKKYTLMIPDQCK